MKNIVAVIALTLLVFNGCGGENFGKASGELSALKQALEASYQPALQKTQQGNITSFDTVDANQQTALKIILTGTASDITPWLKKNIGKYDPIYLYAMAYRAAAVDKAPLKDMFFWSAVARIRAAADRMLCKDKYVGQYLTILNMDLIQPAAAFYGNEIQRFVKDEQQMNAVLKEAADWDKQHPQQNSPAWICNSGHGVSTTEAYPQAEWEKRRAEFKQQYTASIYK